MIRPAATPLSSKDLASRIAVAKRLPVDSAERSRLPSGDELESAWQQLALQFAWPAEPPNVPPRMNQGWLWPSTKEMFRADFVPRHRLVVEFGSFLGMSTRFIADIAPNARIIAVDHWLGSPEHYRRPDLAQLLPMLYDTFIVNCWSYRDRLVPLRQSSIEGLQTIHRLGLSPDVIYVDADHRYESVRSDLDTIMRLFPNALIVGDDWDWEGVRRRYGMRCPFESCVANPWRCLEASTCRE